MKKIAITGGIGSGKSTVLGLIEGMGYYVISADDVNRELLSDKEYLALLKDKFGEAFDGDVFNKKKLAAIIFNDNERRLVLNSIAHIRIRALIEEKLHKYNGEIAFVEVPILVESGMADMFDEIIVVTANRETKINRVAKRDGISKEDVVKRMNSQLNDDEIIKYATYVISNDDCLLNLSNQVKNIVATICE